MHNGHVRAQLFLHNFYTKKKGDPLLHESPLRLTFWESVLWPYPKGSLSGE